MRKITDSVSQIIEQQNEIVPVETDSSSQANILQFC